MIEIEIIKEAIQIIEEESKKENPDISAIREQSSLIKHNIKIVYQNCINKQKG